MNVEEGDRQRRDDTIELIKYFLERIYDLPAGIYIGEGSVDSMRLKALCPVLPSLCF